MPQSYPIQGARKLGVLASGSIITSWELLPGYLLGIPTCPSHRLRGGPQVENCRCWQREEWWVRALAALSYTCCGRGSSNDSRPCGKGRRWPLCPNCSGQKGLRHELWWHPWLSSPRESSRKDKCRAHVGRPLENSDFGKALKRDWRATTLYYGPLLCLKAVVAWAIQVPIEF